MRFAGLAIAFVLAGCAQPGQFHNSSTASSSAGASNSSAGKLTRCVDNLLVNDPRAPIRSAMRLVSGGNCPAGMVIVGLSPWWSTLSSAAQARGVSIEALQAMVESEADGSFATAQTVAKANMAVPDRAQRSPGVLAAYQAAVADQTRDPEAARFRRTFVVRHPHEDHDALCGEINAKNAYGGYVGYQPFYAPVLKVDSRYTAVLWTMEKHGADAIADRCGLSGKPVQAATAN
jgi:hypothetical protein